MCCLLNGCGETLTYPDGSKYVGQVKDGKAHGKGTMTWPDGAKYMGQWEKDEPYGDGIYILPDGKKYEGLFEYGSLNMDGYGVKIRSEGRYVGQLKEGAFHGDGTMTWSDGSKYVGQWMGDSPHGDGMYILSDGKKYEGRFENGHLNMDGYGVEIHYDGYVVQWKDDTRPGYGTLILLDGTQYVGQYRVGKGTWIDSMINYSRWRDYRPHGKGALYNSKGNIINEGIYLEGEDMFEYVGQSKDGLPNGQGTVSGMYSGYEGRWKDGLPHGQGCLWVQRGNLGTFKFIGQFEDGKMHGQGIFINEPDQPGRTGEKYVGQWKDGYMHGQGTMTRFVELLDEDDNSEYVNEYKYVGQWADGEIHGKGTEYDKSGKVIRKGNFKNGEYVGK